MNKIRKGDNVIVRTGKDKGKTGKVLDVFMAEGRVLVDGINHKKNFIRAKKDSKESGQIVDRPSPLHISNVMVVDSKTGKGTRVGIKMIGDKKVRIGKKSGNEITS